MMILKKLMLSLHCVDIDVGHKPDFLGDWPLFIYGQSGSFGRLLLRSIIRG